MQLTRLFMIVMLASFCSGQALEQPSKSSNPTAPRSARSDFSPMGQSQSDPTCYAIRSYLVVRDSPHSDATHRDGYTTCVPAKRIRMYSTVDHERLKDRSEDQRTASSNLDSRRESR